MASPHAKPNLLDLGKTLLEKGPVMTLPTPRRIRILFGGVYAADTTSAMYVWEHPYYPYYYIPLSAFKRDVLQHHGTSDDDCWTATLKSTNANTNIEKSTNRILIFGVDLGPKYGPDRSPLEHKVRVEFSAADAWFEEDTRIHVHPKDPFRRVDVVHSTRPLRVLVAGEPVVLARAASAYHLYETGLPVRYYVPPTAVDWSVLRESAAGTVTGCPYKGTAGYFDVVLGGGGGAEHGEGEERKTFRDLVWWYQNPTVECAAIAGCLCFYNEKVDIELDGVMLERPKTSFS